MSTNTFSFAHLRFLFDPPSLPQVRTYLLLRSILWQLAAIAEGLRPDLDDDDVTWTSGKGGSGSGSGSAASSKQQPPDRVSTTDPGDWGPRDLLVAGLCTLRLLRANMYYLRAAGVSPGTVGLGTSSGGSTGSRREGTAADQRSPFASGLLSLLLDYAGGVLDVMPVGGSGDDGDGGGGEEEEEEEEEEEHGAEETEIDSLRRAVRYEAAEVVGQGLEVFLPEAAQKVSFLAALFKLGLGGGNEHGDGKEEEEEYKSGGIEEESKTSGRGGSGSGTAAPSGEVTIAAAAAMADGPLPVDMDEEGCAALISGVCNAICLDPNLLLSLVPEAVRPALTVRDVPSYVAAKVRSAEKAQAQALQQRMLKEAAASSSTTAVATPPSGGGGRTGGSTSSSPRLAVPRGGGGSGRGSAGEEGTDEFELWKSGAAADLPRSGDVVVRGPDWAWGEQDGETTGRGLVVGLATWGRAIGAGHGGKGEEGTRDGVGGSGSGSSGSGGSGSGGGAVTTNGCVDRNAVRVMWEKGAINVYRWGAVDPAGRPRYDLKVLRAPVLAHDESPARGSVGSGGGGDAVGSRAAGGGKSKGQAQGGVKGRPGRGELKWSVEEVEAALLPQEGGAGRSGDDAREAPTAREVIRFIKNNAPQEWREPRRITGAENALVKVAPPVDSFSFLFCFGGVRKS